MGRARDNYAVKLDSEQRKLREEEKDRRLAMRVLRAKLEERAGLTDREEFLLALEECGFTLTTLAEQYAHLAKQKDPPRGAGARASTLKTLADIFGLNAPAEVQHQHEHRVSITALHDLVRRGSEMDSGSLEAGSRPLLPGGPGVEPVEPTGGSDASSGEAHE